MKTVFILGAGVSQPAGAPLMKDFLDRARELLRKKANEIDAAAFRAVRQKSSLDLENVETVFSAVEMGLLVDKLAGRTGADIAALRTALITVIVQTIERSMPFPVKEGEIMAPGNYGEFADLVEVLTKAAPPASYDVSIITFNYDLGLDYALHTRRLGVSYGLPDEKTPQNTLPLLKLHGSINWGYCRKCSSIVPSHVREARFDLWPDGRTKHVFFDLGTKLPQKRHCGLKLSGPPILVPPTWDKSGYHKQIVDVWKKAALELGEAENVFVIGYSLPETDLFFRYLFALGSESRTLVERFWVFNPDLDGSVKPRFERLIGPSLNPRFKFFSREDGHFWSAIQTIKRELLPGPH